MSLSEYGNVVSLDSLGNNYSMLYGNLAGILTGGAIAGIGSAIKNKDFDWNLIKERIKLVEMTEAEQSLQEINDQTLKKAFKFSLKGGGLMALVLVVIWPMPLFFADYVFNIGFYSIWVGISIAWVCGATFFIVGLPLIEARHGIARVARRQRTEVPTEDDK